jgi:asparagine synthase (glutamine-hydrolysing)
MYPYLDRDLVDFLFRIPKEQLFRPGENRSLMRRSLKTIVPKTILERRQKALITRGPFAALRREESLIHRLFDHSVSARMGYIDQIEIQRTLRSVGHGGDLYVLPSLMRAIHLELWLQARTGHC